MKLTKPQNRTLNMLLDRDPEQALWVDVAGHDGGGRNPVFRRLRELGLIEYSAVGEGRFRAALTLRGIYYLHRPLAN